MAWDVAVDVRMDNLQLNYSIPGKHAKDRVFVHITLL